jgi:hypothetical protein
MKRFWVLWLAWFALVIGSLIWYDAHLPNCLAIYGDATAPAGQSVYESIVRSNQFMSCENGEVSSAFVAQVIAIGVGIVVPILVIVIAEIFNWILAIAKKGLKA